MLARTYLSTLLLLASLAAAGGTGKQNWGCASSLQKTASQSEKSACSGAGSFFVESGGQAICSSSKTRTTPSSDSSCPLSWAQHKTTGSCLPPTEVCEADCGEGTSSAAPEVSATSADEAGYTWSATSKKCTASGGNGKCSSGQCHHSRSQSCCDNSWSTDQPEGPCDTGKSCPKGWFWHMHQKKCKPTKKRSPKPDCSDWNDKEQCCGGSNPTPSDGVGGGPKPTTSAGAGASSGHGHLGGHTSGGQHGGGHTGGGYPGGGSAGDQWSGGWSGGIHKGRGEGNSGTVKGHSGGGRKRHDGPTGDKGKMPGAGGKGKRDFMGRRQSHQVAQFDLTDLDRMYCPKGLHACSIITPGGGEWAYECIDYATELESCGGCASVGEGTDCTALPFVQSVGCEAGLCAVYSCKRGLQSNGTACV